MKNITTYEFFASCGRGLEGLLADELRALGVRRVRPLSNGVAFFGTLEDGMRACLWLRSASRVLLILERVAAGDSDILYSSIYKIVWEDHIAADGTFAIDAFGRNDNLRNTQFVTVRVKDAIVDRIRSRDTEDRRPNIERERPQVRINVNLRGEKATIALDLSGEPLHRRGYRVESRAITAPLKESLAAAMLLAAGWDTEKAQSLQMIDPFCGSGTIAIEAALIAADRAPGLLRSYWGFSGWLKHDEDLWYRLLDEADDRADKGAERLSKRPTLAILASDTDAQSLQVAVESAKRANLQSFINFKGELSPGDIKSPGMLVTNPPYGQRLSSSAQLPAVYAELAQYVSALKAQGPGTVTLITPDDLSETYLNQAAGEKPARRLKVMNGPLESDIRLWELGGGQGLAECKVSDDTLSRKTQDLSAPLHSGRDDKIGTTSPISSNKDTSLSLQGEQVETSVVPAVDSEAFRNRLSKMFKHRGKWARRSGVSCYRLYDADLPDFNVAIDLYQGAANTKDEGKRWLHIAEYKAPKGIDEGLALARLSEVLRIAPEVLGLSSKDVYLKRREQAKGGSQYSNSTSAADRGAHLINEGGLTFEVDLASKLDTGIFLDHRNARALLREKAQGKDCLNLFAYTGTASVYMADGGARSVKTLDLSNPYLEWAQRNMELNGLASKRGLSLNFEKADAIAWVSEQRAQRKADYDLIFVDVPTFSNSAKMGKKTWDVQRDHVELLIRISRLLRHDGEAIFSTNLRNFKPDLEALAKAHVNLENVSSKTVPTDFERTPNIHHAFILKRTPIS